MDEQTTTHSRLPAPSMSSVIIPALPPSFMNNGRTWLPKLIGGAIVVFIIGLASLFVVDSALRSLLVVLSLLGLLILTLLATKQMKDLLVERDEYDKHLRATAEQLCQKNSNLKALVQIDPLTQVLNRRGLENAVRIEISRARRNKLRMFAVLLDCDDFKQINEAYGHAIGDLVLQSMAANIFRSIRPTDYASRVGGDEFIVLLIDLNETDAEVVAQRIRKNIAECPALYNSKAVQCTASLGVAELPLEIQSIDEVLMVTRDALKSSKKQGKNAVTVTGVTRVSEHRP